MNIGERIRCFRNLRGWTQEQLAHKAGLNTAFLGHLERGLKSPTVKTLEKLVKALDITFGELFAEESVSSDVAQEVARGRLLLLIRDLPADKLDKLADIIQSVLEFS